MVEGQSRRAVKDPLSIQGTCRSWSSSRRWEMSVSSSYSNLVDWRNLLSLALFPVCAVINSQTGRAPMRAPGWAEFFMSSAAFPMPPSGSSHPTGLCHFCCSWALHLLHSVSPRVSRLFPKPGVTIWRFKLCDYIKKIRPWASKSPTEPYPLSLLRMCNFSPSFHGNRAICIPYSVSLADATFLCSWVLGGLAHFDGWARCYI